MSCPRWARKLVCWLVGHMIPYRARIGERGPCPRCRTRVQVESDPIWGVWAIEVDDRPSLPPGASLR